MTKQAEVEEDERIETEVEDIETPEGEAEEVELSEIEQVAVEMGWKPKSAWKGDTTNYVDAKTFLKQIGSKAESAGKAAKKAEADAEAKLEKRLAAIERTHADARRRAVEQVHAHYQAAIRSAIRDGDEELEERLIEERDGIIAEVDKAEPEEFDEDQFVEAFEVALPTAQKPFWQRHAWLLDDEADIADFALAEQEISKALEGGKTMSQALKIAEEALRDAYPEKYAGDEEDDAPVIRNGRKGGASAPVIASANRSKGGRSMASRLPPEARATAKRFIEEGLYGSYEEYAEIYVQEGGELQ